MTYQPSAPIDSDTGFGLGSIVRAVSHPVEAVAKAVTKPVASVAKAAARPVFQAVKVAPPVAIARAVQRAAKGQNVFRGALADGKAATAAARQVSRFAGAYVAPLAATGASFVPGIGTGAASAIGAAGAVARGESLANIAQSAAMSAVPGGALVNAGARTAISLARGASLRTAVLDGAQSAASRYLGNSELANRALLVARAGLDGNNVLRAAGGQLLDATTRRVGGSELAQRAAAVVRAGLDNQNVAKAAGGQLIDAAMSRAGGVLPQGAIMNEVQRTAAQMRALYPAMRSASVPPIPSVLSARGGVVPTLRNSIRVAHRPISSGAHLWLSRVLRRGDVGALATYTVQKGDSPWKIAQKLTGNGARYKELAAANPDKAKRILAGNIYYFDAKKTGEVLNLPDAWAAASTPAVPVVKLPDAPAVPVTGDASDAAAKRQARDLLMAWATVEATAAPAISPAYGSAAAETLADWSARDRAMASTWQAWSNRTRRTAYPTDGAFTQSLCDALKAWAEERAAAMVAAAAKQAPTAPVVLTQPASTIPAVTLPPVVAPVPGAPVVLPLPVALPAETPASGAPVATLPPVTLPSVSLPTAPAAAQPAAEAKKSDFPLLAGLGVALAYAAKII